MKHLILGRGRFSNIRHSTVKHIGKSNKIVGSGNAGHGGYVKKNEESKEGKGVITKKLRPLKFKM